MKEKNYQAAKDNAMETHDNMTHREIVSVMKFKTIIHGNCLGINKRDTVLEDDYLSCVIY